MYKQAFMEKEDKCNETMILAYSTANKTPDVAHRKILCLISTISLQISTLASLTNGEPSLNTNL